MDYTQRMKEYISTEIQVLQNLDFDALNRAANASQRAGTEAELSTLSVTEAVQQPPAIWR